MIWFLDWFWDHARNGFLERNILFCLDVLLYVLKRSVMCIVIFNNAYRMLLSFWDMLFQCICMDWTSCLYSYAFMSCAMNSYLHIKYFHIILMWLFLWVCFYYLIFISHLFCFEFYFSFMRASYLNFNYHDHTTILVMFFCFNRDVFLEWMFCYIIY